MDSETYIIEVKNLVKHFNKGKVKAVDGLNLRVKRGEIYAFIGANGTGKSTSLNIISGVLSPTSGEVVVDGLKLPEHKQSISQRIGIAPQEYSIYTDLTAEENIRFFASMYRIPKEVYEPFMEELLDVLQLREKRGEIAKNLSGGMKRRVSIACSLIHKPKLVIFDEATVGVDPILRAWFWKYFRKLRDEGMTIIVTSHVMDEAEKADRIGLMRAGKLIAEGTLQELLSEHKVKNIEELFVKLSGGYIDDNE